VRPKAGGYNQPIGCSAHGGKTHRPYSKRRRACDTWSLAKVKAFRDKGFGGVTEFKRRKLKQSECTNLSRQDFTLKYLNTFKISYPQAIAHIKLITSAVNILFIRNYKPINLAAVCYII
jgi:hypothetical protein